MDNPFKVVPVSMDPDEVGRDLKTGPTIDPGGAIMLRFNRPYVRADDKKFPEGYVQPWMRDPSKLPKKPPRK